MSYHIEAWLEQGQARLAIVDADSHHLRFAWRGNRPTADLHRLFRELMLLSVSDQPADKPPFRKRRDRCNR